MPSVSLKFETFVSDGDHFAVIRFPESNYRGLSIVEFARTPAKARARLKATVDGALLRAAQTERHNSARLIACKNGYVLLVQWNSSIGEYEYRMAGEDRAVMSATHGGMPDFQTALKCAREHAESSYGGVAWENY